jgi:hypothetical protein
MGEAGACVEEVKKIVYFFKKQLNMEITSFTSDFNPERFRELPRKIQLQVLEYINYLLKDSKHQETENDKFKFDWEGGLSELREAHSSVELQHLASDLR